MCDCVDARVGVGPCGCLFRTSIHFFLPGYGLPEPQMTFFTEHDINAMFSLFDPTGRGHISGDQFQQGELISIA